MAVLFAVTWIMGRQAWHMYPSCSVHWVMQAEMQPILHVFLLSQVSLFFPPLSPYFNRHCRGQERADLFRRRHHNQKGGPERHHLHFPRLQWLDIGSPSDLRQQHGHQSGDLTQRGQADVNTSQRALAEGVTVPPCAPTPLTLMQFGHSSLTCHVV